MKHNMIRTTLGISENLQSLNLEFSKTNVKIVKGEHLSLSFENCTEEMFESSFINGTWTIKEKSKFRVSYKEHTDLPIIKVILPDNILLNDFSIVLSCGNFTAEGIVTKNLIAASKHSNIKFENIIANHSKIQCNMGHISLNGEICGNTEVHCNVGDIIIKNLSKQDFGYSLKVGMGTININNQNFTRTEENFHSDYSDCFNLFCHMGNITVK